jgi:hypothetical protein
MNTTSTAAARGILADETAALQKALRHAEQVAAILDTLAKAHNGESGKGAYSDQYATAADRAEGLVNSLRAQV